MKIEKKHMFLACALLLGSALTPAWSASGPKEDRGGEIIRITNNTSEAINITDIEARSFGKEKKKVIRHNPSELRNIPPGQTREWNAPGKQYVGRAGDRVLLSSRSFNGTLAVAFTGRQEEELFIGSPIPSRDRIGNTLPRKDYLVNMFWIPIKKKHGWHLEFNEETVRSSGSDASTPFFSF